MKHFPKLVFEAFLPENFTVSKTRKMFSAIRIDQAYEQNNCSAPKKLGFPSRISAVNVTTSAGNYGFGHIY